MAQSDIWDASTAVFYPPGSAIQNNGLRLFSGTVPPDSGVAAISRTSHDVQVEKLYFEVTIFDGGAPPPFRWGVGIGTGPVSGVSLALWNDGKVYPGSVATLTLPATPFTAVIGVAISNGQIWWRVNGVWMPGIAGADPVAGIGGIVIPATAAAVHISGEVDGAGQTGDLNTAAPFAYPLPTGFAAWGGGGAVPVNPGPPFASAGSPNPPVQNPQAILRKDRGIAWVQPS